MNKHVHLSLVFTVCLVSLCVSGYGQSNSSDDFNLELYQQGVSVYLESYCGVCHELKAAETLGTFAPSHDEAASQAALRLNDPAYSGEAKTLEAYLRESIVNPQIYFTPGYAATAHQMPAFVNLSEEQLEALVYMLVHQE